MTLIQTFHGNATNGTELTAVYAEQPAANVAFALVFPGNDLPRLVHWGRPLAAPATVIDMFDAQMPQRVSGALDYTSWPSVLPTQSESWIGATRFDVRRDGVELFCKFAVSNITAETVAAGKTYVMGEKDGYPNWSVADEPKQTPTVTVTAEDEEQHVKLIWTCELDETGLIRQNAEVVNTGEDQLEVGKIELAFTVPADANEILTTTGHHLRERSPQRQDFTLGRFAKASMAGRPDFDATLLLSVGEKGFGFTHGNVYSAHVAWSGNSVLSAERLPYTSGVIGGGEVLFGGEISLANGESYTTPWLIGSYGEGLNEVAARFHNYIRRVHRDWLAEHNIAPKPRPVILNTWEAVYFNHDYDTLTALADKAVESGVERFVVDDGWFGSRRDDTSGLGDWQISQDVWPDGDKSLKALADYVHGKGLEFGLWFEPEMVNPDSDLFRAHPDWVLKPTEGRLPMQGRTQQVVDLTNPDAYDYIYGAMDKLVGELGIDYIKWDHNRDVTEPVHNGRYGLHEQTEACYRLFDDLKSQFPKLEIESCSSGGARTDAGILQHADRIWGSDSNDPRDRADIQRYTELVVPPEMIGAHVGPSPAHSTWRATELSYRAAISLEGCSGFEWNILECSDDEVEQQRAFVSLYKELRGVLHHGTVMHADFKDPALRGRGVVSDDGKRAVWVVATVTNLRDVLTERLRMPGLDPDCMYRVRLRDEVGEVRWGWNTPQWISAAQMDSFKVSGRLLNEIGLQVPPLWPLEAIVLEVEAL